MEASAYQALSEAEANGWYYQARRRAIEVLIRSYAPLKDEALRIIDIGCGTAGSTQAWRKYGQVLGVEPSPLARQLASQLYPDLEILPLGIEQLDPEQLGSFDITILLCVLYHKNIESSASALARIGTLQKSGGILIWNEPAYPFLWRQHDRQTAAGRRFYPSEMKSLLEGAGYELVFRSHLLAWAFPIAALLAMADRWRWGGDRQTTSAEEGSDHRPVPAVLNKLLKAVTFSEWYLNFLRLGLPFGVSHLLVARKK